MKINNLPFAMRDLLEEETGRWTPQCPEPDVIWDWVGQEENHPQHYALQAHLIHCNCCTDQFVEMSEIRALTGGENLWLQRLKQLLKELVETGWVMPLQAMRETLGQLASPPSKLAADGGSRRENRHEPRLIAPVAAAVRTVQPTLRWEEVRGAYEYTVLVMEQGKGGDSPPDYEAEVRNKTDCLIPLEAGLEAGKIYCWQVTADTQDTSFPQACFVILSDQLRQEMEQGEQAAKSPAEKIAVYEAYGLYEEAWQQAIAAESDQAELSAIRERLEHRRKAA